MKLSPLLIISGSSALECFTCQTSDPSTCKVETCPNDGQEWACQNEVRSHSRHYFVSKGCKQRMACMNNSIQNDRAAWIPSQCNPLNSFNSVCRCCCDDKDGCNEEDIFCLEAPKCPKLEERKNLEMECTKMREIGSECSFACSGDDELSGAQRISCNKKASWTPEQPRCVTNCPALEFEEGTTKCSNGRRSGSTCVFSCPAGTRLVGAKSTTCAAAGSWTRALPSCEPICDQLDVTNGEVTCSNQNYLQSICRISCDAGFERSGPATQTCQRATKNSAEWDGNGNTSCEATCPALLDIVYGSTSCSNKNKLNSECEFSCNQGFRLLGVESVTCQTDRASLNGLAWSGSSPVCEAVCAAVPVPENGETKCTDGRNIGSTCAFSCPAGTRLIGDKASTCTGFGGLANWTTEAPLCEPVCDELTLKNGEINCSDGNFLRSKNTSQLGRFPRLACELARPQPIGTASSAPHASQSASHSSTSQMGQQPAVMLQESTPSALSFATNATNFEAFLLLLARLTAQWKTVSAGLSRSLVASQFVRQLQKLKTRLLPATAPQTLAQSANTSAREALSSSAGQRQHVCWMSLTARQTGR
ncbi:unnamed protein product [Oikopleura dioica]|uniref:Sushi domain-containing protein n=1 Tax=Oikopleura dioica TaxID=34765 RepID=E4YHS2_OIKDI|nr:unnamed protein product [Oikopleura dioica]